MIANNRINLAAWTLEKYFLYLTSKLETCNESWTKVDGWMKFYNKLEFTLYNMMLSPLCFTNIWEVTCSLNTATRLSSGLKVVNVFIMVSKSTPSLSVYPVTTSWQYTQESVLWMHIRLFYQGIYAYKDTLHHWLVDTYTESFLHI